MNITTKHFVYYYLKHTEHDVSPFVRGEQRVESFREELENMLNQNLFGDVRQVVQGINYELERIQHNFGTSFDLRVDERPELLSRGSIVIVDKQLTSKEQVLLQSYLSSYLFQPNIITIL